MQALIVIPPRQVLQQYGGPEQALMLLERHIVTAHGYATLHRDGFFTSRNDTVETIAERATQATRALLRSVGSDSQT